MPSRFQFVVKLEKTQINRFTLLLRFNDKYRCDSCPFIQQLIIIPSHRIRLHFTFSFVEYAVGSNKKAKVFRFNMRKLGDQLLSIILLFSYPSHLMCLYLGKQQKEQTQLRLSSQYSLLYFMLFCNVKKI
eukprot:403338622